MDGEGDIVAAFGVDRNCDVFPVRTAEALEDVSSNALYFPLARCVHCINHRNSKHFDGNIICSNLSRQAFGKSTLNREPEHPKASSLCVVRC